MITLPGYASDSQVQQASASPPSNRQAVSDDTEDLLTGEEIVYSSAEESDMGSQMSKRSLERRNT